MNKLVIFTIVVFILILRMSAMAFAQESGRGEAGIGTVDPGVKIRILGQVDQKFIDASQQYIKQKLGGDYFNQYISFQSGNSYEDCIENKCTVRNEISFSYKILFETAGDPYLGGPPRIGVTVDNNENIVNYVGPVKPYQFLVSKEEVMEKAKSYGLINVTGAVVASSSGTPEGYELVWAVGSNDLAGYGEVLKEPIYKGVYVDVDTGEIRGEYRINPLIRTSSGTGGLKLDEFFGKEDMQKEKVKEKLINFNILSIVVIAILVIVFLIWYKFYRK